MMASPSKLKNFPSLLRVAVGLGLPALLLGGFYGCQHPAASSSLSKSASVEPAAPAPPPPPQGPALAEFHQVIQPMLKDRCYDCHGDGESRAGLAFDKLSTADQILRNPDLWLKVMKNTRSHIMPPSGHDGLSDQEQQTLDHWIKFSAFGLNPAQLDPGRVTVHRLNRVEYKNTIRDLMGFDFQAQAEFPGDDSGYGFDNIADVLNMSPLLMEKYLTAAQYIVDQMVPKVTGVPKLQVAGVADFTYPDGSKSVGTNIRASGIGAAGIPAIPLSYLKPATITHVFAIKETGDYKLMLDQNIRGDFTYNTESCTVSIKVDGKEVSKKDYGWEGNNDYTFTYNYHWEPGPHTLVVSLTPPSPVPPRARGVANDSVYNFRSARLEGPEDPALWVHLPNYHRFFTRDQVPKDPAQRRAYAQELLSAFATKAFRRPVETSSLKPLVDMAEKVYTAPGQTFETGVAQSMVAVLASPRFLFRVEKPAAASPLPPYADIDEYSLASRLAYFLWSTMPDDELLKLAAAGQLRSQLGEQVKRMLADPRSAAFVESFTGQWLQTRLVTTVPLNPHEILLRQGLDESPKLTDDMRAAFKQEPEKYFEYVVRENRSVDEFLTSDYTFANATLAAAYQLDGVTGPEFRKVTLPAGDWHGGILTMGSVMMVTSNPTRTSPVKRGKWLLDNILGAPTPPPPPNVPALEDSAPKNSDRVPTLRETLAVHRQNALCASCHDRMDPLGLAMENFNALGQVRTVDMKQPIDPSGKLATGEKFADIRDLKGILSTTHKLEFYRCLTEKLLTYALGRGVEYYDVPTVDKIVGELDHDHGRVATLLLGVIESVPFQQQRTFPNPVPVTPPPAPAAPNPGPPAAQDAPRPSPNTTEHEIATLH